MTAVGIPRIDTSRLVLHIYLRIRNWHCDGRAGRGRRASSTGESNRL